jgi:hypothetical protein
MPYGYPVIPTLPGALGQLLNTAPELLERVSALTERLTELLSDRNQESIAGILDNLEQVSRSLAERGPEIAATLAEGRVAIARRVMRQTGSASSPDHPRLVRGRAAVITTSQATCVGRCSSMTARARDRDAGPASGLLQPDPARGRPADARPQGHHRIAARHHRPVEPAGDRRRGRRPAPARLCGGEGIDDAPELFAPLSAARASPACFGGASAPTSC